MGEVRATLRQEYYWRRSREPETTKPAAKTQPAYTIPAEAYVPPETKKTWTPAQFEQEYGVKPDIPKGSIITKVEETKEGYRIHYVTPTKVTFKQREHKGRWSELSLAPYIAPTLISIKKAKLRRLSETLPEGSFERGFIASSESFAETFFPYPTPRPRHHELGYIIFEAPIPEKLGYLTGEIAQAAVMGKILEGPITVASEQIVKVGKKVVPESVKHAAKFGRLAKAVHKAKLSYVERVPWEPWRGSKPDVWLAKHSKWYFAKTRGLAKGEVVLPEISKHPAVKTMPHLYKIKQMGPIWKRIKEPLIAEDVAWQLAKTPGASGIWVRNVGLAPVKEKTRLLPQVTQTLVTRMGIHPYVPRMVTTTGKKGVRQVTIGLGVSTFAKTVMKPRPPQRLRRKVWEPTFEREREKLRPLTILQPKEKERKRAAAKVAQALIQPQVLRQKEIAVLDIPQPQRPTLGTLPRYPPFWLPRGPRETGGRRFESLFGKWFYKKHPIPSGEKLAKEFMSLGLKRRKRKRKRRG